MFDLGELRDGFDIAPSVNVVVSDDVEVARDMLRPLLALYIGGMGARGANFYNALFRRYGYEAEAERIQSLYLEGKKREAAGILADAAWRSLASPERSDVAEPDNQGRQSDGFDRLSDDEVLLS